MKSKSREPLNDDFVSIHDLRNRNKNRTQLNYFKDEQKKEGQTYPKYESEITASRWDKLKSYLMNFTEELIFEPFDEEEDYSEPNISNRNLMLATESIYEPQYSSIQIARLSTDLTLSFVINTALNHLEQFLRNIQIGFILDAETLEFNQIACNTHINKQLAKEKEITLISKCKAIFYKQKSKYYKFSLYKSFRNLLPSDGMNPKTLESLVYSIKSHIKNENNQIENDP